MRGLLITLAVPLLVAASDVPDAVPLPADKPSAEAAPETPPADKRAKEEENSGETEPPEDPPPSPPDEAALAACEAQLKSLGAVFERNDPIDGPGTCGMAASYEISEIVRGIALGPDTQMRCATALATARWVDEVVIPAAKVLGDDVRLTGLRQASTYACRSRNSQAGAKISEHAKGNAVDIATFSFEGHEPLSIRPDQRKGSREESFQMAVRAGACLHFTTVLGPGSDAYHDDHLHLDLAKRRSGYRLCQ